MEFNFKPKVAGAGSFSPPPGYELIDGQWQSIVEGSIAKCSGAEAATKCQPSCSTTAEVSTKATESTGCAKSTSEESAE